MKRFLTTAVLALLAVAGLSACGGDEVAVTVNGHETMTVDELQDTLDELAGSEDMLTSVNGRGDGNDTLRSGYVGPVVIGNVVLAELLRQDLEEQGIEVTDQDVTDGTTILSQNFAAPQDGSTPLTLDQVPDQLEASFVDLYSRITALLRSYGGDPTELPDAAAGQPLTQETQAALTQLQDHFGELRQEADVEIDPRWGRWVVTDTGADVQPPEGPLVTSTTVPLAVPAGG